MSLFFLLPCFLALPAPSPAPFAQSGPCLVGKVTADDAFEEDHFGTAVALSGDTLFVAAPYDNVVGRNSGSVYAYRRNGLNWFLQQKLVPPDAERGQAFGANLATDGQTLVVLASRVVAFQGKNTIGLYVYELHGTTWTFAAKLDPIGVPNSHDIFFAAGLAVSGDWIFATRWNEPFGSGTGSIHAYRRSANGWAPDGRLAPIDPTVATMSVSLVNAQGDTLAISASGSVYLFERVGDTWVQGAKLQPHDAPTFRGAAVAIDGDTIAVGSAGDSQVLPDAGAAYVFEKRSGTWVEAAKLAPPELETRNEFGYTLGLAGDALVVGTIGRGKNGSAFAFRRSGGAWLQQAELEPEESPALGFPSIQFGRQLAVSGDLAVLAASDDDQREPDGGSVYVYSLSGKLRASLTSPRALSWGKQRLEIDRGPEHAGHTYRLLGSLSGTSRGIPFRGTRIPLNPDAYFAALIRTPWLCPFANTSGVLDAVGRATLVLAVPPDAYDDIVGLSVDHAFVERGPFGFEHVSNAVTTRFAARP